MGFSDATTTWDIHPAPHQYGALFLTDRVRDRQPDVNPLLDLIAERSPDLKTVICRATLYSGMPRGGGWSKMYNQWRLDSKPWNNGGCEDAPIKQLDLTPFHNDPPDYFAFPDMTIIVFTDADGRRLVGTYADNLHMLDDTIPAKQFLPSYLPI